MAKTFDSVHETKQELFLYLLAKQANTWAAYPALPPPLNLLYAPYALIIRPIHALFTFLSLACIGKLSRDMLRRRLTVRRSSLGSSRSHQIAAPTQAFVLPGDWKENKSQANVVDFVLEFCIKGRESEEQMGVLEELGRSQRELFTELASKVDTISDRLAGLETESRKDAAFRAEVASHTQKVEMVASRLDRCEATSHDETTSRAEVTSRIDAELLRKLDAVASRLEVASNANAARQEKAARQPIAPSSAERPANDNECNVDDPLRSSPNQDIQFETDAPDATMWPDIVLEPALTENARSSAFKSVACSYPTCDLRAATSKTADNSVGGSRTKRRKRPLRLHEGDHVLHRDSELPQPAVSPRPAAASTTPVTGSESHSVPVCNVLVAASSNGRLHARASGARRFRQSHARVASLGPTLQQEASPSEEDGEFRAFDACNVGADSSQSDREFRALLDWDMEMMNAPSQEDHEFRALQHWLMGTQETEKEHIKDPASSSSLLRA